MNSPTSPPDPVGIGIIVPFDFALDREYWGYVPDHVTLHVTRTEYVYGDMGVDLAAAVAEEDGLARATVSLLAAGPAVVTYACTSGSFVGGTDGEERIRSTLRRAGAKDAQTTSGALIAALSALGCRHVAVATPYTPDVGERLLAYLGEHDIDTVSHVSMGLTGGIAHVPEQEILDIARSAMRPEADALFISSHEPCHHRRHRAAGARARHRGAGGQPGDHVARPSARSTRPPPVHLMLNRPSTVPGRADWPPV